MMMIIPKILRKRPFGLAKNENLPRILRQKSVTRRRISPRPIKYAASPIRPEVISSGNTVARRRE